MRKLIWDGKGIRNPDLMLKPLKISIPYIENLDLDAIKAANNNTIDRLLAARCMAPHVAH